MAQRWYVIHAYSGFEGQVKRSLEERIKRAGFRETYVRDNYAPPRR